MNTLLRIGCFACLLSALTIVGCGPGKGDLTGKVLFDGKPMTKGQVNLQAGDGSIHASEISPEGTYTIKGIPSGTVKIGVSYSDESQTEYFRAMSKAGRGEGTAPKAPPKLLYQIPEKYADFNSSGITAVVKSGTMTTFDVPVPAK